MRETLLTGVYCPGHTSYMETKRETLERKGLKPVTHNKSWPK